MSAVVVADKIRVLGASAVAVSGAADTAENILATVNIPAGAMGLHGILRITTLWTITSSANNKTMQARLGGIGGTGFFSRVSTTVASVSNCTLIRNRGAANSQIAFFEGGGTSGGWGDNSGANRAGSIDTSVAQTLVITGQKASAGETITLESYLVELILP